MFFGVIFGTMFILFVLMIPIIVLFGLLGMAFKSLGAMALFALKYLLPSGIIGFVIARKRAQDRYFPPRRNTLNISVLRWGRSCSAADIA